MYVVSPLLALVNRDFMELVKMETLNGKHVLQLLLLIYITFSYSRVGIQCSLGFLSIKDIDDQADVIILRTDPLYKTAA